VDNVIAPFGLTYCSFGTHYRQTEKTAECHDYGVPDAAIIGCRMKKFSGAESGKIMQWRYWLPDFRGRRVISDIQKW
jgi:hypothetical protein